MAKMSKSDRLSRYRNRLNHAKRWREQEGYDDTWKRMLDLYKGKHFPAGIDEEDRIAINMAFSTINVIFPALTVNHPKIEVLANQQEDEDRAVISEAIVNYWWRHYDFRAPFRRATKDFLTVGHGWIKVGYKYEEREESLGEDEMMEQQSSLIGEADMFAAENPDMAADLPTDEEIKANLIATKTVVTEDRPTLERVSPFDMFVDPEATCMEDASWIAQRIVRPLEEVRSDKRYNYGPRRSIKADAVISSDWLSQDQRKKLDSDVERVTIWEYYDIANEMMCVFTQGGDEYLVDPQEMPYVFGHPYEFIANYDVPDEFYPIGDLEMVEAPQQELNKTRSQMMNHRKKYGRKYLYRASALGPEGRQGLESNEDNIAIEVIDDNQPLQDVIMPVPITPMAGDLYQYSDIIQGDMDKVSGVNEYARGATPEIRRTATEAAMIQDGANARSADKLSLIEIAIGRIARKILQLAQQYMTGEQAARITGADGKQFWFKYSHEDIEGEFDFQVEGGSTQPQNETFRRQQAVAMMNSLGPLVGQIIDPAVLARHVLQFGFGVKSPGKFMIQQQPPMPGGAVGPDGQPLPPEMQGQMPPEMQGGPPMGPEGAPMPPQGPPMPPEGMMPPPGMQMPMGGMQFPAGAGMDAPQMDPNELLAAQQQGRINTGVMGDVGKGGLPPELIKQLQNQMGM
jgi:hypothetical protein